MILYTRQEDTQKMKIVDEYFGCDVFSTSAMQRYLPHAVYKQMMDVMEKGKELPKEIEFSPNQAKNFSPGISTRR
mgnify:FL=1